jgi:hypothetical protein
MEVPAQAHALHVRCHGFQFNLRSRVKPTRVVLCMTVQVGRAHDYRLKSRPPDRVKARR